MKKFILILLLSSFSFALTVTPYSLEGLKEVKVRISDKSRLLTRDVKQKIKQDIIKKLQDIGIKTTTELYSKFIIKIKSIKIADTYVLNISLFIVEDVLLVADKENIKMAITYKKDDFFDSENLKVDILESIDYLVSDFLEQYKDEN